jgi:hypothetical protein
MIRLPVASASRQKRSGAGGRNRTDTSLSALRIFVPLRLSPPLISVRGLDYPFALAAGLRRRPSSLYTFPGAPGLGSGSPVKGSPNLSGSTSGISPSALNPQLKSVASTSFATPAFHR